MASKKQVTPKQPLMTPSFSPGERVVMPDDRVGTIIELQQPTQMVVVKPDGVDDPAQWAYLPPEQLSKGKP